MIKKNCDLMSEAKDSLEGKWWTVVQVTFVFMFFSITASLIGFLPGLVVTGPVCLAMATYFLAFSRGENPRINHAFHHVNTFEEMLRAIKAYALTTWFIFWWSLLLIIPGLIKMLSYSQIYYILADHPHMGVRQALDKSMDMMDGHKWKLFCLWLSFLGWALLALLTFGIGLLWLIPYVQITMAKFYDEVSTKHKASHV